MPSSCGCLLAVDACRAYMTSNALLLKAECVYATRNEDEYIARRGCFSPTSGPRKRLRPLAFSRLRCIATTNLTTQAGIVPPVRAAEGWAMRSSWLGARRDGARTYLPDAIPASG